MNKNSHFSSISMFSVEKVCCYLVILTGFFGVALLPVDIGLFTLFPYRIVQRQIQWYFAFLFFWFAYAVISLAWVPSKSMAIRYLIFLFMGISVIFFSTYYFREKLDLQKLYLLWMGVFITLLFLGFWEHLTGYHLSVSKLYGETYARFKYIPTAVFYNQNDYATFLTLSIPFGIGIVRYSCKKYLRFFGLCSILGAFYLIVAAGSRANIIAVLFELAFILLFLLNFKRKIKAIITISICIVLLFMFLPGPVQGFFSQITEKLNSIVSHAGLRTGSIGVRMNLVRNGLLFLYSTAGFGVGAGNAEYYMANFAKYYTAGITNPHNWWLEILVDYGILVFVGYIIFYIGIMRNLWKIYRKKQKIEEKMICEALLVSLVGFFFASISSSSIMAFKPQWLLFAFALSFLNYFRNKEEKMCI
ncbi:MAG: O-antigen ligase family protein [Promethearchaeota archaeon]